MHQRLKNGEAKCGGDRREPSSYFGQRVTCAEQVEKETRPPTQVELEDIFRPGDDLVDVLTAVSLRYGVRFVIEPKVA